MSNVKREDGGNWIFVIGNFIRISKFGFRILPNEMRHILTPEQVEELRKEVKDKLDYMEIDKLRLYYRYWLPEKVDKILLCLHGLGGHGGGYKLLAEELNKENIALYALDQRGHGLSDGIRGDIEDFYLFIRGCT